MEKTLLNNKLKFIPLLKEDALPPKYSTVEATPEEVAQFRAASSPKSKVQKPVAKEAPVTSELSRSPISNKAGDDYQEFIKKIRLDSYHSLLKPENLSILSIITSDTNINDEAALAISRSLIKLSTSERKKLPPLNLDEIELKEELIRLAAGLWITTLFLQSSIEEAQIHGELSRTALTNNLAQSRKLQFDQKEATSEEEKINVYRELFPAPLVSAAFRDYESKGVNDDIAQFLLGKRSQFKSGSIRGIKAVTEATTSMTPEESSEEDLETGEDYRLSHEDSLDFRASEEGAGEADFMSFLGDEALALVLRGLKIASPSTIDLSNLIGQAFNISIIGTIDSIAKTFSMTREEPTTKIGRSTDIWMEVMPIALVEYIKYTISTDLPTLKYQNLVNIFQFLYDIDQKNAGNERGLGEEEESQELSPTFAPSVTTLTPSIQQLFAAVFGGPDKEDASVERITERVNKNIKKQKESEPPIATVTESTADLALRGSTAKKIILDDLKYISQLLTQKSAAIETKRSKFMLLKQFKRTAVAYTSSLSAVKEITKLISTIPETQSIEILIKNSREIIGILPQAVPPKDADPDVKDSLFQKAIQSISGKLKQHVTEAEALLSGTLDTEESELGVASKPAFFNPKEFASLLRDWINVIRSHFEIAKKIALTPQAGESEIPRAYLRYFDGKKDQTFHAWLTDRSIHHTVDDSSLQLILSTLWDHVLKYMTTKRVKKVYDATTRPTLFDD